MSERVALVTGGSRGIGLACAHRLLAEGHRVAVTFNTTPPPTELTAAGALAVRCDVTSSDQVDQAVSAVEADLGPVTVLVSNAGVTADGLLMRMSEQSFASVLDANLTGAYRLAKRTTPGMMKARWGRMIFLSSVVALRGQPGQANYAASKAGLVGLARSLARELASRAITANVVAPGPITTDMTDVLSESLKADMTAAVPLGRFGSPEEVAAVVAFLASEDAGYVTGALVPVDGGLGMGH